MNLLSFHSVKGENYFITANYKFESWISIGNLSYDFFVSQAMEFISKGGNIKEPHNSVHEDCLWFDGGGFRMASQVESNLRQRRRRQIVK